MSKKVLIITYYWPPSGGSPVLRWLKFAKYLRNYGWEPVIYTPENPQPQEYDESNIKEIPEGIEIIKRKIREPYRFYKILTGKKRSDKLSAAFISEKKGNRVFNKLSVWLRSNLFIPDPRRFWIGPSIRFLSRYLKRNPVNAVITTAPPHSMHLIGLGLKKKYDLPWLADFRDPWTKIDFYSALSLTRWADKKHRKLEKKVLQSADCIITIGDTMAKEFASLGANRVITITNGFDDEIDLTRQDVKPDQKFSILHVGSIPSSRNVISLWKVLSQLVETSELFKQNLELKLIGSVDHTVIQSIKEAGLENFLVKSEYLPHNEAIKKMASSQVLLLLINNTENSKGILTNKFFEYLSVKRPILAIGPEDGDAGKIISHTQAGKIAEYSDEKKIHIIINDYFKLYLENKLEVKTKNTDNFTRKNCTKKLAEVLDSFVINFHFK